MLTEVKVQRYILICPFWPLSNPYIVRKIEGNRRSKHILGGSGEVGVVGSSAILDGDLDTIIALATLVEVALLEVVCLLVETVEVSEIVPFVDDVEGVGTGSVDVHLFREKISAVCE